MKVYFKPIGITHPTVEELREQAQAFMYELGHDDPLPSDWNPNHFMIAKFGDPED